MNTYIPSKRKKSSSKLEELSKHRNQGRYQVEVKLEPEKVIEIAREHFPEENGIQKISSEENCISFGETSRPWIGDQVQVFTCPTDQEDKTEVTVQHYHRGRAVKKFLDKLH
ncbi:MAG: hypothetical protein ACLFN4_05240 [Candidatus Acetothermia bacterium]